MFVFTKMSIQFDWLRENSVMKDSWKYTWNLVGQLFVCLEQIRIPYLAYAMRWVGDMELGM